MNFTFYLYLYLNTRIHQNMALLCAIKLEGGPEGFNISISMNKRVTPVPVRPESVWKNRGPKKA